MVLRQRPAATEALDSAELTKHSDTRYIIVLVTCCPVIYTQQLIMIKLYEPNAHRCRAHLMPFHPICHHLAESVKIIVTPFFYLLLFTCPSCFSLPFDLPPLFKTLSVICYLTKKIQFILKYCSYYNH